jgi:hypothetical protein
MTVAWIRRLLWLTTLVAIAYVASASDDHSTTTSRMHPAGSTEVCGYLNESQVWDFTGSPYFLCPAGVVVSNNAQLTIDASRGPVQVFADGVGGLSAVGGSKLRVISPSPNMVLFDAWDYRTSFWSGITATDTTISNITVRHAIKGLGVSNVAISHVSVSDSGCLGIAATGTVDIRDSEISNGGRLCSQIFSDNPNVSGISATGSSIEISNTYVHDEPLTAIFTNSSSTQIVGNTVTNAAYALHLAHSTFTGAAAIMMTDFCCGQNRATYSQVVNDNVVSDSGVDGGYPAIDVSGNVSPPLNNRGVGNGIDAIRMSGFLAATSTQWVTDAASSSVHPLSYLNGGLIISSGRTLIVPANAVVKSTPTFYSDQSFVIQGGQIDASAGGATFTSVNDNSVGSPMCPSLYADAPCQGGVGAWGGFSITQNVGSEAVSRFTDAEIRFAQTALKFDALPAPGSIVPPDSSPAPGLIVRDSSVHDVVTGLRADGGRTVVETSKFARVRGQMAYYDGEGIHVSSHAVVDVRASTFDDIDSSAVRTDATTASDGSVSLTNVTVRRAALQRGSAVELWGEKLRVSELRVDDSGSDDGAAAVRLSFSNRVGSRQSDALGPIRGKGNRVNYVNLSGTFQGDFTWQDVVANEPQDMLGYITWGVTFLGPGTVQVEGDRFIRARALRIGANLVLHGGGIVGLAANDGGVGPFCDVTASCEREANIDSVENHGGYLAVDDAILRVGATLSGEATSSPADPNFGYVITDSTVEGWIRILQSAPIALRRNHIAVSQLQVDATGLQMTDNLLEGGSVTIGGNAFPGSSDWPAPTPPVEIRIERNRYTNPSTYSAIPVSLRGVIDPIVRDNDFDNHGVSIETSRFRLDHLTGNVGRRPACVCISGYLMADTTWPSYVIRSTTTAPLPILNTTGVSVEPGVTMSVPAGTLVVSASGGFGVQGQLVADGGGIVFDSLQHVDPDGNCTKPCFAGPYGWSSDWGGFIVYPAPGGASPTLRLQGVTIANAFPILYHEQGSTNVGCARIVGNRSTVAGYGPGLAIHYSDLYDNGPPDIQAVSPVDARRNYWGQSGGPTAGQVSNQPGPTDTSGALNDPVNCQDRTQIVSGPQSGSTTSSTVTFTFAAPSVSTVCALDGASPTACTSPLTFTGLANGSHTFVVDTAADANGGRSASRQWTVAPQGSPPGAPSLSQPSSPFVTASTMTATWSAPVGVSARGFDARYRRAPLSGAFAAAVYPPTWQNMQGNTVTLAVSPGNTYCFSTRVRTDDGVSNWSQETCASRLVDDTSLSGAWTRTTGTAYVGGSARMTTVKGAKLTGPAVTAQQVAVQVTRCPTCGSFDVFIGSVRIGTVDLRAATTANTLIALPKRIASISGQLSFRVTSAGRRVVIDAFGVQQV